MRRFGGLSAIAFAIAKPVIRFVIINKAFKYAVILIFDKPDYFAKVTSFTTRLAYLNDYPCLFSRVIEQQYVGHRIAVTFRQHGFRERFVGNLLLLIVQYAQFYVQF